VTTNHPTPIAPPGRGCGNCAHGPGYHDGPGAGCHATGCDCPAWFDNIDIPGPSWEAFGKCPRCGATTGVPCVDLRRAHGFLPTIGTPRANPHPGRRQVGPHHWRFP